MGKFNFLYKIYLGYNKVAEIVAIIILAFVTVIVFLSVGARYIFEAPFEWSEEIARYGFIWICFLGYALAEKSGDHFRITYVVDKFSPKVRLGVEIFLNLLILVVLFQFFKETLNYYEQGKSGISTILLIPLNYVYVSISVAVFLMFLNRIKTFVDTIIHCVRRIKDPNYIPPEANPEYH